MCAQFAPTKDGEEARLQAALAELDLEKNDIDPRLLEAANDNALFLPYQKEICFSAEDYDLTVVEKSRRIGATWGLAGWSTTQAAASRSAGGQDVLYIGPSLDMAREFIDTCAVFAKALHGALLEVEEFVFNDADENGENTKEIKAFRIEFASGYEIIALTSHPRSLRGRQGIVIIDEAAFHDDLDEVLKAAIALQIWGGKVIVLSTHNGEDNAFNTLIEEIRAKRREGNVIRVTFDDALMDGLYKRICFVKGKPWSQEAEDEWAAKIRKSYGTAAEEELDVIPTQGSGVVLSLALIKKCSRPDIPVIRWETPKGFMDISKKARAEYTKEWLKREVDPILKERIIREWPSYFGQDFARVHDLSVIWLLQVADDLKRHTPFVLEMADCPYQTQEQILFHIVKSLPRFGGGAIDSNGNGGYLGEVAGDEFGSDVVEAVMMSEKWYRENMPPLVADIEDENITLPQDRETQNDFRLLKRVRGVIRVPDKRVNSKETGAKRHGDSVIAAALADYAAGRSVRTYDFTPTSEQRLSSNVTDLDLGSEGAGEILRTGFGSVSGGIDTEGFS